MGEGGELPWASTEDEAAKRQRGVDIRQQRGYNCQLLNEPEFHRLEPGITASPFIAGVFSPSEGIVEPAKVIQACLQRLRENGGTITSNTDVLDFTLEGQKVTSVKTTQGDLPCDSPVFAAGVGTTELAFKLGINVPQQESPGVVLRTDLQPALFKNISVLNAPALDGQPMSDSGQTGL